MASQFSDEPEECYWTELLVPTAPGQKLETMLPECGCRLVLSLTPRTKLGAAVLDVPVLIPDAAAWWIDELALSVEAFSHSGYNGPISGFLKRIASNLRFFHSTDEAEQRLSQKLSDDIQSFLNVTSTSGNDASPKEWALTVTIFDITGLAEIGAAGGECVVSRTACRRTTEDCHLLGIAPPTKSVEVPLTNEGKLGGKKAKKTPPPAGSDESAVDLANEAEDESRMWQPPGYSMKRIVDAASELPIFSYSCDVCHCRIFGERYHCTECSDYDMCTTCWKSSGGVCTQGKHRLSHERYSFADAKRIIMGTSGGLGYQTRVSFNLFADRPCIGTKQTDFFGEPRFPAAVPPAIVYNYLTYSEVYDNAIALAKSLHKRVLFDLPLPATHEDHNGDPARVGIYMRNSPEWVVFDLVLTLLGVTIVPIDPGASRETIAHILGVTDCHAVICHADLHDNVMTCLPPSVRHVVVVPPVGGADESASSHPPASLSATVALHSAVDLLRAGRKDPMRDTVVMPARKPTDVFTLIFTSGSTGRPKGAIQTHDIWAKCGFDKFLKTDPVVNVAYRPFSYATDRELIWRNIGSGGRVAIFTGPITNLLDELVWIQPSSFSAPPRVWNGLFERFNAELRKAVKTEQEAVLQKLMHAPEQPGDEDIKSKMDDVAFQVNAAEATARNRLLHRYSKILGKRAGLCGVGSAPVRPEVFAFMRECFESWGSASVYESYGTTENGGITLNGYVYTDCRVMLIDVPEMGFLTSNVPQQGEICVITEEAIPGYWKDPENTAKLFFVDDKGEKWIKTGDIGEMRDGRLFIIDRRANLVKLASGVFISPEFLEGVFLNCASVKDCFVHAEAHWEFPMAVVSLSDAALAAQAKDGRAVTSEDILREIRQVASERGVAPTNVPHGVYIAPERFSVENGCLTISLKLSRPGLRRAFKETLERQYNELVASSGMEEFRTNSSGDAGALGAEGSFAMARQTSSTIFDATFRDHDAVAVQRKLVKIFKHVLHLREIDVRLSAKELGADSITVTMLRERVLESTKVPLTVQQLWEASVENVARAIANVREAQLGDDTGRRRRLREPDGDGQRPGETSSGGGAAAAGSVEALAAQLRADSEFNVNAAADLAGADSDVGDLAAVMSCTSSPMVAADSRAIFLTGATGFIGGEILRQLTFDGRATRTHTPIVFCLVRGSSIDDAVARLVASTANHGDDAFAAALRSTLIPSGTVRVVLGDLATASLGLASATAVLRFLRKSVTEVIHCGANVNHMLPYSALAAANVHSVHSLLHIFGAHRFGIAAATPTRCRSFTFVSTISVTGLTQSHSVDAESAVLAEVPPEALANNRAGGYSLSKWAAERVLIDAAGKGVIRLVGHPTPPECAADDAPVGFIVRCGMTSWHSKLGHGNESDWLARLCRVVDITKAFPGDGESRTLCEINIAPVDWMAAAVLKVAVEADETTLCAHAPHGVIHLIAARPFNIGEVFEACKAAALPLAAWHEMLTERANAALGEGNVKTARLFQSVLLMFSRGLPGGDVGHSPRDTLSLLRTVAPDLVAVECVTDAIRCGLAAYCLWLRGA